MKTINMKTLAAGIAVSVMLFTGCKKTTTGPTGPQGPQGTPGVVNTSTDGFIKGTVSGTERNGTPFSYTFNYTNYWGGPAGTLDSSNSFGTPYFTFNIQRGTDILSSNSAQLSITSASKTSFSTASGTFNFTIIESLGTNKEFQFSLTSGVTPTLTGLSYNASTGILTGNFSVSTSSNNTGNTATITGSFQCTMTQLFYHNEQPVKTSFAKD